MIFLGKEVRNFGEPFIVAEISANHGGDINRAFSLIEAAKIAGADAVKVQCYEAIDLTLPNGYVIGGGTPWKDQTLYELYTQAQTPLSWMAPIFSHAKMIQIPCFSSVYSERGLAVLKSVDCPAYKIASYEANDTYFIKKVADTGRPVVISVGTLGDDEIHRIASLLEENQRDNLILLHCVSSYPCALEELGLRDLQTLQEDYNYPVGFSCHSDDPGAVLLACGLGAAVVEVHLALEDEQSTKSPDWSFSFTPEMLRHTAYRAKLVKKAIGFKNPIIETPAREFKRSLYVVENMEKGDVFTNENVKSYRPYQGCSPHLLPNIIGRKANRSIPANTPLQMEFVE